MSARSVGAGGVSTGAGAVRGRPVRNAGAGWSWSHGFRAPSRAPVRTPLGTPSRRSRSYHHSNGVLDIHSRDRSCCDPSKLDRGEDRRLRIWLGGIGWLRDDKVRVWPILLRRAQHDTIHRNCVHSSRAYDIRGNLSPFRCFALDKAHNSADGTMVDGTSLAVSGVGNGVHGSIFRACGFFRHRLFGGYGFVHSLRCFLGGLNGFVHNLGLIVSCRDRLVHNIWLCMMSGDCFIQDIRSLRSQVHILRGIIRWRAIICDGNVVFLRINERKRQRGGKS